ncbi:transposable element Tcb2 transposase [Trichonephila clavipes]|uniref:Transposable element Tcb2 transposase n=1 Tax=Trichonephila clavipes TaxID=2585209 RepID=A0A8X6S4G4_TRICX|nr:transposable element Tcb2 transposase [Trichonephila clavipes]
MTPTWLYHQDFARLSLNRDIIPPLHLLTQEGLLPTNTRMFRVGKKRRQPLIPEAERQRTRDALNLRSEKSPNTSTITHLRQRFRDTASVADRKRSGRTFILKTKVADMETALQRSLMKRPSVYINIITEFISLLNSDERYLGCSKTLQRVTYHGGFHRDASLKAVDRRAPNNSKYWQWTTAWQADWHQVVFSDESRFNLWDHDVRIRFTRYVGERYHPECVIERNSSRTPGKDNTHPHVAKTVRDSCSARHMRLFLWPAYSTDMSPIGHVWDLVGRCLARDPRPVS